MAAENQARNQTFRYKRWDEEGGEMSKSAASYKDEKRKKDANCGEPMRRQRASAARKET